MVTAGTSGEKVYRTEAPRSEDPSDYVAAPVQLGGIFFQGASVRGNRPSACLNAKLAVLAE
jgi:hypothetical protein